MNWQRAIVAGLAGGIAINLADFVMHGIIMAETYTKFPVFSQEPANPLWFLLVAICIGIPAAILFAQTRNSWTEGIQGGIIFGFWLGLVTFFPPFYDSLVIEGFPYFLSWCWGGANLISFIIFGAVVGGIYKSA
jgi:hypothetical protein